ncbi:MAG TPA: FHA domain-containing protein [Solirubrobacteraceae bacterium]
MADLAPPVGSAPPGALVLVLPNGVRLPIRESMTIGRGETADVKLEDRTVSRLHARIDSTRDGPMISDAGSRFGVRVAGQALSEPRRLTAGTVIQLGNVTLRVESAVAHAAPGVAGVPGVAGAGADPSAGPNATIVVPVNATQLGLRAPAATSGDGSLRPRLRSGWALKQIEGDAEERWILRDLRNDSFRTIDSEDAALIQMLDGRLTVAELLTQSTDVLGSSGPGRLARLIAGLGERGMLDGIAPTPVAEAEPGLLARAFKPREKTFGWLPGYFQRAYRHWGRIFFSPLTVSLLVMLSVAGIAVFAYLVGARYGTPLVVANRVVLGGAVFIVGRFAIVMVHELAHGMALAHYNRTTTRAGIRLLFIFPYAFVDTSEAYFESRMHRIVISAAGPATDFSLAALFSIMCAVSPKGNLREVFFQLAFAGYVGAFFNANPFLDRDGYQILCEWLRVPKLKERARAQLRARLSGTMTDEEGSPVLARYAVAGLVWSVIGVGFVVVLSLRYYDRLSALLPHSVVIGGFILFIVVLLLPVVFALVMPMISRARYGSREVNRVVR